MPADAAPTSPRPGAVRLAVGVGPAVAAAVLAVAAAIGRGPLVGAVVVAQVVMAVTWLAVIGMPAAAGGAAIVVAAAIAADVYVARDDALTAVAGVVAASFVAALLMQLARRRRRRVTTSLAGVMSGVVLAVLTAYLLAIQAGDDSNRGVVLVAAAVAVSLVVGRALDVVAGPPAGVVAHGWLRLLVPPVVSGRGWPGVFAGLAAAAGVGALLGRDQSMLGAGSGALIGVTAALAAELADIAVSAASAEVADARRLLAVRLLAVVLPVAAAAPVGYAVTTIAVG